MTHAFVYDGDGRVMGEYGANASDVIAETIWLSPEAANDNQFGGDDGIGGYAPLAVATGSGSSAALTWVHGNNLGVPIAFTNASGTAVPPPSYALPGFPGQTQTLSDLYYNRYRDYDSSTGRYFQADPIGLNGGANPYAYANDNPLRFTDPSGLCLEDACVVEGIIGITLLTEAYCWASGACGNASKAIQRGVDHLIKRDCDNGDEDDCEIEHEHDRATCRSAWGFVARDGLAVCYQTAFERLQECRFKGGARTRLFLPPRRRGRWNY